MAHVLSRDVEHAAAFEDASVVHENLNIPTQRLSAIPVVRHVELLDLKSDAACSGLPLQGLDLCPDLD